MELTARELLTHLFQTAIDEVDGRFCVQSWCRENNAKFDHCIAIGKAAPAMLQGALDHHKNLKQALLICPPGQCSRSIRKDKRINIIASSHPVPDQTSLDAGEVLLRFLAGIPQGEKLLVLISGGTSSLVEVMIEGLSLDQLQQINQHLLASGKNIQQMNAWRKQFSRIKGGGLLEYVQADHCTQLLISDVQNDDASVIGSGLLVASQDQVLDDDPFLHDLLNTVQAKSGRCSDVIESHVIATQQQAMQAAYDEAEKMGVDCYLHEEFLSGEAEEQGVRIAQWLLTAPTGVHIWGGETTVTLPDHPGTGGRNQQFALAAAQVLDGYNDISLLAAGTDGIDGNTPCAGAVVYGSTVQAAQKLGMDVQQALKKADAGKVLMATEYWLQTGPTNTNVMDLVIAYKR
ncbi:glycerate kinase [Pseudomonadota bacterium]